MTPSVPLPAALRPDLVLVALAPRERVTRPSGVVVLPANRIIVDRIGVVLQVGAAVTEVAPHGVVLFDSNVGEEVLVDGWPCLLLRVQDIDAVLERDHARRRSA